MSQQELPVHVEDADQSQSAAPVEVSVNTTSKIKSPKKVKSSKIKDPITQQVKQRKKRTHRWTDANRKSFYEKCVPARQASLEAKKKLKAQATESKLEL